jgi:hypothetical protein
MTPRNRQFVRFVKLHLAEYGMTLVFGRGKSVNTDGFRCAGFFNEDKKIIKIAKNTTNFMAVLVHEYCHFLQYINNSKIYEKSHEAGYIVDNWLKGKNYDPKVVKRSFFIVRAMERDCEKRAIKIIKKFELNIDTKIYAKKAHCYIYSHFIMERKRKFDSYKKSPYSSQTVLKNMPSTMATLSHRSIPPKIYSMLESFSF